MLDSTGATWNPSCEYVWADFGFKEEFMIVNTAIFGRGICSIEYLSKSLQSTRLFLLFIDLCLIYTRLGNT